MSEASKPTPGPWFEHREGFSTVYVEARIGGGMVQEVAACGPTDAGQYQQAANARLIAEAGTVHHETGLTPRQLVEQRDALATALAGLDEAYCRAGAPLSRDERAEDRKRLIAARAALALVKGAKP
ncbi:hypothetical protein ABEW79_17910 [Delftia tsuruhatensis]|uniref:hypothetical protein n=1 Tax=Delftia tsuruhatensis TaxID=180282 RepID=UPI003D22D1F2